MGSLFLKPLEIVMFSHLEQWAADLINTHLLKELFILNMQEINQTAVSWILSHEFVLNTSVQLLIQM